MMTILNDEEILELCKKQKMIENYLPESIKEIENRKILSAGLSPSGYDVRPAREFKIFSNINSAIVDPKRLDERCLTDAVVRIDDDGSEYVIMPPNSYLLGKTVEKFNLPDNVTGLVTGKSSYARAAIVIPSTVLWNSFSGEVVLEVMNCSNLPAKVYANEGIATVLFFYGKSCRNGYRGQYQGQKGIRLPSV